MPNFFRFIIVFNERRISSHSIITHIIRKQQFEKLSSLKRVVRRLPIHLLAKTLNHRSRKLQLAISDDALLQIFDITFFDGKGLQVIHCRWIAETTDLENRRVVLPGHVLSKRPEKL